VGISFLYRLTDLLRHRGRLRVWNHSRAWGRRGEDLAHRHLRSAGYTIVARNYRTRSGAGEVDLIGWDGDTLAFIEVKTRSSDETGTPDRAVGHDKQQRLIAAAADYARRAGIPWERTRFDVVTVVLVQPVRILLVRDAFAKSHAAARGAV
jgi:putative endonuclease